MGSFGYSDPIGYGTPTLQVTPGPTTFVYDLDCFRYGATPKEAGARFFILDEHGLITKARSNLKQMEDTFYDLVMFT